MYLLINGSVRKMKKGITIEYIQSKYPDKKIEKCCKPPSMETLEEWMSDCGAESIDGCWTEPDGYCEHGYPSWPLALGYI